MRTSQRGSIVGFVIVGAVLALLLVGGAYAMRRTLASNDGEVATTQSDEKSEDTPQPAEESTSSDKNDERQNETPTLPGGDEKEAQPDSNPGTEKESVDNLPQTGPADMLFGGIVLSGMAAAGVAYKRSRDLATSL